jgi:arabinan endo-1,5-alpha-L-arabinosidase
MQVCTPEQTPSRGVNMTRYLTRLLSYCLQHVTKWFPRWIALAWIVSMILTLIPTLASGKCTFVHDPVMIKAGEDYYLFATGQGISIQRSRDLLEWDYVGTVFQPAPDWAFQEVPKFDGNIWAPDISYFNGTYHLYYSISSFGSNRSCIGLAVNTTLDPQSPDYQWIDQGKVIESFLGKDNWNAIDPNLAVDAEGRYYLAFGSFWDGIKMVAIDPQTGKPAQNPPEIISLARRPSVQYHPIEAPFIIHKSGSYYLFVSFDFCCKGIQSTYKIAVGRAQQITGPYVDQQGKAMLDGGGTILLEGYGDVHGPGHNAVLQEGDKEWLVHHMYDGKRGGMPILQIRPIIWTDDGWPRAGEPLGKP